MNKCLVFVSAVFFIGNVFALSEIATNISVELDSSYQSILELSQKGFNVNRINESYNDALGIFEAQKVLEKND